MFLFSSNGGIYHGDFIFRAQPVLRRRTKHIFSSQIVLRRRVKQRLATTITFKGVIEGQNSSSEGWEK